MGAPRTKEHTEHASPIVITQMIREHFWTLVEKYPNDELPWDSEREDFVVEQLARLAQLASPQAFEQVVDHIFEQLHKTFGNGHHIGYEHREMKVEGIRGVVDHHGEGKEPYWGLFCATIMSTIGAYLRVYSKLTPISENNPDFDQHHAIKVLELSKTGEIPLETLMKWIDEVMPKLFAEEFAVFCEDQKPKSLEEAAAEIEKNTGKEFIHPNYQVHVWMPNTGATLEKDMVPIVMIEAPLNMLPVKDGNWNHIVAHLVSQKLNELGLGHYHETGVVTWVIHGDKRVGADMKKKIYQAKPLYMEWQSIRPDRQVVGISTQNTKHWSKQYDQCVTAVQSHEFLGENLGKMYKVHPYRNLLAAVTSPKEGSYSQSDSDKYGVRQLGFLQTIKKLEELGYQRVS